MAAMEDVWGTDEQKSLGGRTANDIRADHGVNAPARETPAIMRATTQLALQIDSVEQEVKALIETITPVMTPVNEKGDDPQYDSDTMPGGQSDLSNWLRQKSAQLDNLARAVNFARNRVEL